MTDVQPAELSAVRYRFRCTVTRDLDLPAFAGSALRGIFGHSLRDTVCSTGESECAKCPLYRSCRFPAIFAPPPPRAHPLQSFQDIPPPYVIEPATDDRRQIARNQNWSFDLVLFGHAIQDLPVITHAWERALSSGQLGPAGGSARLDAVETLERAEPSATVPGDDADRRIRMRLETPLRIQQRGRILGPSELNPRAVLMAIARRVSLLAEFHDGGPPGYDFGELARRAEQTRASGDLRWREGQRHSRRQKRHMPQGGVVGEWTLEGPLAPFQPLLTTATWTHAGKHATFGLGRLRWLESSRR